MRGGEDMARYRKGKDQSKTHKQQSSRQQQPGSGLHHTWSRRDKGKGKKRTALGHESTKGSLPA